MSTVRDYWDIYLRHGIPCPCDVCIMVRKWMKDIEQYEYFVECRKRKEVL